MKAIQINTDGSFATLPEPNAVGGGFSLTQLQKAVGGFIEVVSLPTMRLTDHKINLIMVVNEEGKLTGLPINPLATLLYGMGRGEAVVGPVVICPSDMVL